MRRSGPEGLEQRAGKGDCVSALGVFLCDAACNPPSCFARVCNLALRSASRPALTLISKKRDTSIRRCAPREVLGEDGMSVVWQEVQQTHCEYAKSDRLSKCENRSLFHLQITAPIRARPEE